MYTHLFPLHARECMYMSAQCTNYMDGCIPWVYGELKAPSDYSKYAKSIKVLTKTSSLHKSLRHGEHWCEILYWLVVTRLIIHSLVECSQCKNAWPARSLGIDYGTNWPNSVVGVLGVQIFHTLTRDRIHWNIGWGDKIRGEQICHERCGAYSLAQEHPITICMTNKAIATIISHIADSLQLRHL